MFVGTRHAIPCDRMHPPPIPDSGAHVLSSGYVALSCYMAIPYTAVITGRSADLWQYSCRFNNTAVTVSREVWPGR